MGHRLGCFESQRSTGHTAVVAACASACASTACTGAPATSTVAPSATAARTATAARAGTSRSAVRSAIAQPEAFSVACADLGSVAGAGPQTCLRLPRRAPDRDGTTAGSASAPYKGGHDGERANAKNGPTHGAHSGAELGWPSRLARSCRSTRAAGAFAWRNRSVSGDRLGVIDPEERSPCSEAAGPPISARGQLRRSAVRGSSDKGAGLFRVGGPPRAAAGEPQRPAGRRETVKRGRRRRARDPGAARHLPCDEQPTK